MGTAYIELLCHMPIHLLQEEVLLNTDPANLTDKALADMITNLPGLTFNVSFRQFSGYLTSTDYPSDHLFYW